MKYAGYKRDTHTDGYYWFFIVIHILLNVLYLLKSWDIPSSNSSVIVLKHISITFPSSVVMF